MKVLLALLVLTLSYLSGKILGDDNTSQQVKTTSFLNYPGTEPAPCLVNYSCLNYTTVRICSPSLNNRELREVGHFTCPSATAWCDPRSGTCIAEQPQEYLVPSQFQCLRDGKFPNVHDCASYFYCQSGKAYIFKCVSPKRYYNPVTESCATSSVCANQNVCNGKNNVKVKVGDSKYLFVYCANSTIATVDKCIGEYQFNPNTQVCERFCPHAGLFPSAENCTNYYKCDPIYPTSSIFNITDLTCPSGEGFLQSAYECMNRTLVPNCQVGLPAIYSK